MDFRLLDYSLKMTNLRISLCKIYGLGLSRSSYLCSLLGLGKSVHILYLNKYFKDSLRYLLLQYTYNIGSSLRLFLVQRFELYISIFLYKGVRFLKGLPLRGQRTSSNSQSIRRFTQKLKHFVKIDGKK